MRILLVDDDELLIEVVQRSLGDKNYVLDAVTDGEQGWIYASTYSYDLVILDWHLPKLDGISLCKRFRNHGYHMPILLLTACRNNQEKIMGLDAGADDYLCKPFNIEELAARVRALLRRSNSNSSPVITWGDLQLDTCCCQVTYQGDVLLLTTKEYQLLELFMRHHQEVFSIEEIMESLWSSIEYPSEATVRSQIRHLRRKLKLAGVPENPIETLRGQGYCLKSLPPHNNSAENISHISACSITDNHHSPELLPQQDKHLAALTKVWEKYQPKSEQHLTVLQEALEAWKAGNLSFAQREEAQSNAHKLAGTVGIFGFTQASQLANQLELLLQKNISEETRELLQFQNILNNLRTQLAIKGNLSNQISCQLGEDNPLLLIIDHDRQFTELLNKQAIREGIRTAIASSPESVRTWLEELQDDQLPNVVLMRLSFAKSSSNFTSLDEYLSLITKFNSFTPSIPVIVIADQDQFEERLLVAKYGDAFYFKQPITAAQAIAFCQQVLQTYNQGKKVMIVDDDVDLLRVLTSKLKPWGFKLTTLHDTRQFWDVLQAVTPDLLILDIEMPYFRGTQLCKVLRTDPYWFRLPVIYLSIHEGTMIEDQGFVSGADELVHKPVKSKQLARRILYHLRRNNMGAL